MGPAASTQWAASKERANFVKAVELFERVMGGHRLGKLVAGEAASLSKRLNAPPWFPPLGQFTFSVKRLLDVFIYTRYVHQPSPDRERQFAECLAEVKGKIAVLAWLFLGELHTISLLMNNAGKNIAWWFDKYCEHHQITPDILDSLLDLNPGIGSQEKEADRKARLHQEKVEEVAAAMWQGAGSPAGGPAQFFDAAKKAIEAA